MTGFVDNVRGFHRFAPISYPNSCLRVRSLPYPRRVYMRQVYCRQRENVAGYMTRYLYHTYFGNCFNARNYRLFAVFDGKLIYE